MKPFPALPLGVFAALTLAAPVSAQDVEMLGRVYGTRPPAAYFETRLREPGAFRLARGMAVGRRQRMDGAAAGPGRAPSLRGGSDGAAVALGDHPVQGTFRFPVLLGLFSDSPPEPFTRDRLQAQFFDGPNPTGTIPDLYREMSGGRVTLVGETLPWARIPLTRAQVTGGVSGLSGSPTARVGEFIIELLARLDGMDWGRFDNDGADGIPNSGDDDGFVDVLAVIHPTPGAECGGGEQNDRVWSHKWTLLAAAGQDFVTSTPSANGGRIRVSDYTIQPAYSCDGASINEIGVMAHELGHGFGLPDLYANGFAGVGRWDLMGTGSWGCSAAFEPERPCHMGAWSKAALGWVTVQPMPSGADLGTVLLDPVETGRRVLSLPAGDGSGEYFLLENRQRLGFDGSLSEPGLLVWQIDPELVGRALRWNAVNQDARHLGVWLRQADGLAQLVSNSGNRGDGGDPFPGTTGNTAFHAGSLPAAFTHTGSAAGVTLFDIHQDGLRMGFRALTRYQTVRLRITGDAGTAALFTIDGVAMPERELVRRWAPFERHAVAAVAGATLGEGIRRGFSGWEDDPEAPRERDWTTGIEDAELVAAYGGPREMRLDLAVEGARFGVVPGDVAPTPQSPDLWFDEGSEVALLARATRGFRFGEWKGALAGLPNPAVFVMDAPRDATAAFDFVFGIATEAVVAMPAASPQEVRLEVSEATLPVRWTLLAGALPDGVAFQEDGALAGAALVAGSFPLQVAVVDALGLEASGALTLRVTEPVFGTRALAAPFLLQPGSLSDLERRYLDGAGNGNGAYDLGDLRAWVLTHPDAPAAAAAGGGPRSVSMDAPVHGGRP